MMFCASVILSSLYIRVSYENLAGRKASGAAAITETRMKYLEAWMRVEPAKSASRIFLLLLSSMSYSNALSAKIR